MNLYLFKNKNFSLLILAKLISLIGTAMQSFALSLYVLKITGSGKLFASVLVVGMIPSLILGPVCGVLADWFDRKKTIVVLDLVSGIVIGLLYIISITYGIQMLHIYIVVVLMSIISSLFSPAIGTAIPTIVQKDELMGANSINSLVMNIGSIFSPILAGALYGLMGLQFILLLNAASFFFSAICEAFLSLPKLERKETGFSFGQFAKDFKEGLIFIKQKKLIYKITICALIINVFLSPILSVGLLFMSKTILKITDIQFGFLNTSMVAGSMLGIIAANAISKKLKLQQIFYLGLISCGFILGFIALVVSPIYLNAFVNSMIPLFSFILSGFLIVVVLTIINMSMATMLQQEAPIEILGRVTGVLSTVTSAAIPLGQMGYGIMFDNMPCYISVIVSMLSIILVAVYFNYSEAKNSRIIDENVNAVE